MLLFWPYCLANKPLIRVAEANKLIVFLSTFFFYSIIGFSQAPELDWVTVRYGTAMGHEVKFDQHGNVITGGVFGYAGINSSILDIDPGPNVTMLYGSNDYWSVFVQKLNPEGNFLWGKAFTGSDDCHLESMLTDPSGNIYISGSFKGSVNFGGTTLTENETTPYLLLLNESGNLQWIKTYNSNMFLTGSIVRSQTGDIYLYGGFKNSFDIDTGLENHTLNAVGDVDGFILRLDASGNYIWSYSIGTEKREVVYGVDTGPEGEIYCAGSFEDQLSFNIANNNVVMYNNGFHNDLFVVRMTQTSQIQWAKQIGGHESSTEELFNMQLDLNRELVLTGNYIVNTDFDPSMDVQHFFTRKVITPRDIF